MKLCWEVYWLLDLCFLCFLDLVDTPINPSLSTLSPVVSVLSSFTSILDLLAVAKPSSWFIEFRIVYRFLLFILVLFVSELDALISASLSNILFWKLRICCDNLFSIPTILLSIIALILSLIGVCECL